jgi:hypothetical protein
VRCCEEGDFDQLRKIPKPSEGPKRLLRWGFFMDFFIGFDKIANLGE